MAKAEDQVLRPPDGAMTESRGLRLLRPAIVLIDAATFFTAWWATLARSPADARQAVVLAAAGAAVAVACLASLQQYQPRARTIATIEAAALLKAAILSGLVVGLVGDRAGAGGGTRWPVTGMVAAAVGAVTARAVWRSLLQSIRAGGGLTIGVVVVGSNDEGHLLADQIGAAAASGYRVLGVVGDRTSYDALGFSAPWLGPVDRVAAAVAEVGARAALLVPTGLGAAELNSTTRALLDLGVDVHVSGGLRGIHHRRLRPMAIGSEHVYTVDSVSLTGWQTAIKRVVDVSVAAAGLVVAAPVLAAAALAIRLEGRGGPLFSQVRVGRDGAPFTIYKLRTMVVGAEAQLDDLQARNERTGPLFKLTDDPRVTRVGRVLRATSIDELPQLWNVLAGSMSLVGPRPALPDEVAAFHASHLVRHRVKPGVTGLWQVEARDQPDVESYHRHDTFYVENWSVALDVSIIGRTVVAVALRAVALLRRRRPPTPADPAPNHEARPPEARTS